ncbi:MAG: hypothetical protein GF334_02625 [Candidatus Altiarchaeales archaeon]|nr:hypothetical protein [Candidatus Altiarchaeales archaeon]
MDEDKIKQDIKPQTDEISECKKEIVKIGGEIKKLQKDADHLRDKRDEGNNECKSLAADARQLRDKRDSINQKIAELKKQRDQLNKKSSDMSDDIKNSKQKRDELNEEARGTDSTLKKLYEKNIDKLVNRDMPLRDEKKLFKSVFEIRNRLEAAKLADEFHEKVVSTYKELKELDDKTDELTAQIRSHANEAEEYHLKTIELYDQLHKISKESDEYHEELIKKYDEINKLRDQIKARKDRITEIEQTIKPQTEILDGIRQEKEKKDLEEKAKKAREKLKEQKRVSFNDLRVLFEQDKKEQTD